MTGSPISRRQFLGGSGAVIAGFSLVSTLGPSRRAGASVLGNGPLTSGPAGEVDNQWIVVQGTGFDNLGTSVTVYTPKVEFGTGVETALSQIVAEELNVSLQQLTYVQGDTDFNPATDPNSGGYTAGSQTVQSEGPELRLAAAAAYQELLTLAAAYFNAPATALTAFDGFFFYRGRLASYGQVIGTSVVTAAPTSSTPTKSYTEYRIVGQPVPRVDLPAKFFAEFTYSADVRLPGMLYARVIRPKGRNATFAGFNAGVQAAVMALPGIVGVYQTGNFVYVLSTDEGTAQQVALDFSSSLAEWTDGPALVAQSSLPSALMNPEYVYAVGDQVDVGDPVGALAGAQQQLTAQYFTPFYMHGSMGASAAVATYDGSVVTVYSGTQGPGPLQAAIISLLQAYDPSFDAAVHIVYTEQPGCYGHDGADDCSAEAALIAYQLQGPVKLQWTRADENQWEPLGPAMVHAMQGGLTSNAVVSWQHDIYSPTHNARPGAGTSAGNLLVRQYLGGLPAAEPPLNTNLATRNGPVNYAFPNSRTGRHFVTSFLLTSDSAMTASSPLTWVLPRSTALRSLGGFSNSFANESFMDELAYTAGIDPLAFRLSYLSDPRAVAALNTVAKAARWNRPSRSKTGPGPTPPGPVPAGHARGRGLSFIQYENALTYVATIADVDVELSTGQVTVTDVWVAHDCGLIINPDGLQNQIQGNVIQGVSRTLIEQVDYTGDAVVQNGWYDYAPYYVTGYNVINFDQIPNVSVTLLDQPSQPAWGAGEPAILSMPAAIGNAFFAATGVRIRSLPMTPANVLAALGS